MVDGQRYHLLDEALVERLDGLSRDDQGLWLFLSPSEDFQGRWSVESLQPDFFFDFEEIIGHYRTVSPAGLDNFLSYAQESGYQVVFTDPPEDILHAYDHLHDLPPFSLNSTLEGTQNGMLPWQITGFNKLIRDERLNAGCVVWDTGTGKTAFIASAILWHMEHGHPFDLAFVVVKSNNKRDMQKKLMRLADVESVIIDGPPKRRWKIYEEIQDRLMAGEKVVAITNYEKYREDHEFFAVVLEDRDVLFFWDEMPTRLSNRNTILYKAVKKCLWSRFTSKEEGLEGALSRAAWMRQFELSATPIENSPEGQFNCIRMMNPPLLGRVEEFEGEYVGYKNPFSHKPEKWINLDKLEPRLEHMTHRVSRDDPEVAKYFPKVIEDPLLIDWHPTQRRVYDVLTGKAKEMIEADFDDSCVLSLIQVMQMVCDAPSMIVESAKNRNAFELLLSEFEDDMEGLPALTGPKGSEVAMTLLEALPKAPTDKGHTKLETLREIILEKHPDEKVLIFMTWASYGMKPLTTALDEWGVSYVTYEGSQKQADAAKDRFREDPSIRVFLSSDRGADSIDLPEAAVGVNYNLPWTWVRKRQRMRNVRADSILPFNYWYDLLMADSIEERKQDIIATKHGYHKALYDGAAFEESMSAKLTREDLLYILLGAT
jgi:SNF2 family DNA or RNA helicase